MKVVSQYKLNKLMYDILLEFYSVNDSISEKDYNESIQHFITSYCVENVELIKKIGAHTFGISGSQVYDMTVKLLSNRLCSQELQSQYHLNTILYDILLRDNLEKDNYDIAMYRLIYNHIDTRLNTSEIEIILDDIYGCKEASEIEDKPRMLKRIIAKKLVGVKVCKN